MGRISDVIVGENRIAPFKCASAVVDNDINKPLKLSASDTVAIAGDGDEIYGFLESVETHTEDGKPVIGVQASGRKWVLMSGTYAVGDLVEAAANTAVSVANAGDYGICKTHTLDDTDAAGLIASMFNKNWQVIYGPGTDGSKALIELIA